jgi:hypothetical protein
VRTVKVTASGVEKCLNGQHPIADGETIERILWPENVAALMPSAHVCKLHQVMGKTWHRQ